MQHYRQLDDAVRDLRVLLPSPKETWRLVADPVVGEINGLPHLRGATIATNGIMVLLVNELDQAFFGHLQWFVPDDNSVDIDAVLGQVPPKVNKKQDKAVVKLLQDYATW